VSQPLFVSNASPIIAFERLGQLDLLQQLTQALHIPPAVHREVFGSLLRLPKSENWIY
jgi:predicted nucleic acid-binding protein